MKPKPFRIFRAGTHMDSAGTETTFTREELAATVKAYNEGEWRAPLVCGHPKGAAPAFGWVGQMRLDDAGEVWVDSVDDLNSDFADLMQKKAYRNRSASWYHPEHPSNPTPGVWQLRHLGVLGAQPPALKGLGDVEFNDNEGLTVDFADYNLGTIATMFGSLRDLLVEKFGLDVADKVLPRWSISDLDAASRRDPDDLPNPAYSDPEEVQMTPQEIEALQAKAARADALESEVTTLKADKQRLEGEVTSFAEQRAVAERASALETAKKSLEPLVTAGKVLPAQVDYHAAMLVSLNDKEKSFEFGEHTGENALTQRGAYLAQLQAGPKVVEYSDVSGNAPLPKGETSAQLGARISEYRDQEKVKGRELTFAQALNELENQQS